MLKNHLSIFALLFAVAAGGPAAAQTCKAVAGQINSQPVPCGGLCTAGQFSGGVQGSFTFTLTTLTPSVDTALTGVFHYTGDITITTKDGTLTTKDAGGFDLVTPAAHFASVSKIVGGTGALVGASGILRLEGAFATGCTSSTCSYRGTVCTP